ncbi:MAG: ATP-binding protein [Nitrospirota bacterium]
MSRLSDREKKKKQLVNKLIDLREMLDELQEAITEFQEAEEKIQEKIIEYEKLSALGRLTANVAHEIRNPITVIGGLAERLKKRISPEAKEKEYLDALSSEAKRLEEILKEILFFSDKAFFKREMKDINKIIEDSLIIYEDTCNKAGIGISKNLGNVPQIYIDERQVRAAISNLISNAVDAMPEGGTLTVTAGVEYISGKNYVVVKVTDTGIGIAEENLKTIYEPFFSTKSTKKETGLGLPITRKIVEGHGGLMKIDSVVGKGSTFGLFFPYRGR